MLYLVLPWPPTVNTYWRSVPILSKFKCVCRLLLSVKARKYRAEAKKMIMAAGSPKFGDKRIKVEIWAYPPDRRERDLDNLPKGVFDALTHADVWRKDSQIDDFRVVRKDLPPLGKVELFVSVIDEQR